MCENCEKLLLHEEERIEWYKKLDQQNLTLHKKVMEQEQTIVILKQKLLQKRSSIFEDFVSNLNQEKQSTDIRIQERIQDLNSFIRAFNKEKELFQKAIQDNEKFYAEHISYLNGIIEYFREGLFKEFEKSNGLKKYFSEKLKNFAETAETVLANLLKVERVKIATDLKQKYRNLLLKTKEEMKKQQEGIVKLRNHNKQLYVVLQEAKKEHEEQVAELNASINALRTTVKNLKEKNDNLHTQIKLQVEGCQKDIFDARKKIKNLSFHVCNNQK